MSEVDHRIRLAMVGGGQGAFIGEVHRIASRLDDRYRLVAGALSSDPARAHRSAAGLGLTAERSYASYQELIDVEAARVDGAEVVAIVTPNRLHFPVASAALAAGLHVLCDKPLTATLDEAERLAEQVRQSGLLFAVTYNYSGYPMVRQARELCAGGALGTIRVVQVEYPQDWLATALEETGQKQAAWRTDPVQAGAGGSIGDIGTHAFHLAEFVTGLRVESLLADLHSFVANRQLDDNANMLLRFSGGARGSLWASQVAAGHENGLRLRVYGDKAGLEWFQEAPDRLRLAPLGEPPRLITRGSPTTGSAAAQATRLPPGHPEGFLEGFANLYRDFATHLLAHRDGHAVTGESLMPGIEDGLRGMRFIDRAVASSQAGGAWTALQA
jgi:predicted dehydrogenase